MIWASKLAFVAEGAPAAGPGTADDELLALAMSRPRDALARARRILAGRPEPLQALIAHQAAGIVLRETADVPASIREFRQALRLARRTGSAQREADVLAHSAPRSCMRAGPPTGWPLSTGPSAWPLARWPGAFDRRGNVLWILDRYAAALEDFRRAVSLLQQADDPIWTARALNGRGLVHLESGTRSALMPTSSLPGGCWPSAARNWR